MPLELVSGKSTGRRYRDWIEWLKACSDMYDRFVDEWDISPFEENEQSLVGFLAAGAAIAGFLPIVEMSIEKTRHGSRGPTMGRSDLWIAFKKRTYSFEAKRAKFMVNSANLSVRMRNAIGAIEEVGADEHDKAAALLGAYVRDSARETIYKQFANDPIVDLAFRFGPSDSRGAYLFFGKAKG